MEDGSLGRGETTQWMWRIGWVVLVSSTVGMAVPNMVAFGLSIRQGLRLIDWFYPWPQNHKAFLSSPFLIRSHILGNGTALLCGLILLYQSHSPPASDPWAAKYPLLLSLYFCTLLSGSVCSIFFSARNAAHKPAGTVSFLFMALGCLTPASISLYYELSLLDRRWSIHWLARSCAALYGAFVLFRLFALVLMPLIPGAHKREFWFVLTWASWWLPSALCDVLLAPPRCEPP